MSSSVDGEGPPLAETRRVDPSEDGVPRALGRGAVIGRYLVLSLLGRGGMGEVYSAYDPELYRRVAIKVLHAAHGSESARRRLLREARALGKLSHPHVVQVYDVGEEAGDVFVAMELVEGESLEAFCRRDPRPAWQEVLAVYIDAARGLSAAHERGLIHRDVKPANILRGNDGRVRVVDFGLAGSGQASGESAPPGEDAGPPSEGLSLADTLHAPPASVHGERLTAAGAVMGTPLYMAPEQHRGPDVTAACDQYSLCVALYEALYGRLPFALDRDGSPWEMIARLREQKEKGPPAAPPAGTPVPAWIHRTLARGLAPTPEDRYPSVAALIAALSEDPDARRRPGWTRSALLAGGAAIAAIAAAGWLARGAFVDPCAHPERALAGVWDGGVKDKLRTAFTSSGRSYAEDTAARATALLDRYAGEWSSMRGQVCQASRAGTQAREILDRRDECLERRKGQLQALATLLAEKPDGQVVDRAVQAAAGLYPVAYCADAEALTARVHPPEDPTLRARVAALQPRVDRLEALHAAGKYKDGLPLIEPLLAETASIPHAPLRAQVEYWSGALKDAAGDYDGAKALIRASIVSAADGADDLLAAEAWGRLLFVVGERQRRFEEAAVIATLGPAAAARAHDDLAQATWLDALGVVQRRMGKLPEAKAAHEHALALREKALGPEHLNVAQSLNNLALVLFSLGDYAGARAAHERSLSILEKAVGPDHPMVASSLTNLGLVLAVTGDYRAAATSQTRALAIKEKALGSEHISVASTLVNLANALSELGDLPQALTTAERAAALYEKGLGPDHPNLAYGLVAVGRIDVRLGRLDAARPLLERARALREKAQGASEGDLAEPLLVLGELHLARGKADEAIPLLERALAANDMENQNAIELALAEALWQSDKDRPRARDLAEKARAAYARVGHRSGLDRATRWLSEHERE